MRVAAVTAHMGAMSNCLMPATAELTARVISVVRSLSDEQLAALMASSRRVRVRRRRRRWGVVNAAAPELAEALDRLHAEEASADMPRFQALAARHQKLLADDVKGRAGKAIAATVIGALLIAAATGAAFLGGLASTLYLVAGALLSGAMIVAGYMTGRQIAHQGGHWMFADPGSAAAIVWDAGIDAAAGVALKARTGEDGITPNVVRALTAPWAKAGLDTAWLDLAKRSA